MGCPVGGFVAALGQREVARRPSVPGAHRAAFVKLVERSEARRRFLVRALLRRHPQCADSLTSMEFAFAVLVESSAITIPF
jgi:hypothetical protein